MYVLWHVLDRRTFAPHMTAWVAAPVGEVDVFAIRPSLLELLMPWYGRLRASIRVGEWQAALRSLGS